MCGFWKLCISVFGVHAALEICVVLWFRCMHCSFEFVWQMWLCGFDYWQPMTCGFEAILQPMQSYNLSMCDNYHIFCITRLSHFSDTLNNFCIFLCLQKLREITKNWEIIPISMRKKFAMVFFFAYRNFFIFLMLQKNRFSFLAFLDSCINHLSHVLNITARRQMR